MRRNIALVLLGLLSFFSSNAQFIDDWEARPSVSIAYQVNKKLEVEATYYLYLIDNLSRFEKSLFSGELEYEFAPWAVAGLDYRYGTGSEVDYHDLRYSIEFAHPWKSGKWILVYRPTFQQKIKIGVDTDNYLRNKLELNFLLNPKVNLFIFTENYQLIERGLSFNTQKNALGGIYSINRRHKLELQFTLKNKRDHKNYARLETAYVFKFGQ